ncbi:hypothetical protein SLEP1_g23290 [Rubroshorea leprosula]|uniref:Reverse transcriptase/retrotransposon-derived protein RNase H-like domain-containing protein n=1 Tax=Rubroshorea leprosula TaxID=152421 RepID=A0AAV5JL79_9ROSI|nr:hypothetical protein SLEP1_g23290 [Rubroshorea leprosula]
MRITQREGESLKNYMNRFNDAMLEVNAFDEAVGVTAVMQGLNHDRFRDNLIKNTPTTFDEVNQRSLKFIKAEEYVLSKPQPPKEARTPTWRDESQSRKKFKPTQNRGPISVPKLDRPDSSTPQTRPTPPSWTSFAIPRSQILMQIKNKMEMRRPNPLQSPATSRDHTRYCDFHQDHGHTTEECKSLKSELEIHKLSTNPLRKPVAQKRRLFGGERLTAIKEEVKNLLQAGFIRRVDYCEWIANPVMVKKSNGKWRMCIDYTNLNDACPKDCHPMPSIDKLVEAALGNERLSLLDAYSGYHQVRMAPEDKKMVTIVFRAQIGRNLEVYVDDIVVKSSRAEDHLTDLAETFNNLRRCSMKLNPAKCTFGVESGKFLGFMVSRRGIEVNPEKIKAIEEMRPPRSTKDVQRLAGRVAALYRFISKSADKCLPFFKVLRTAAQKDETGKPQKFNWTTECQVAFDELKAYLGSLPLLTKAQEGEILYLYLGISDTAVSSVLVREVGKQQQPVYYASKVLQGAEQSTDLDAPSWTDPIREYLLNGTVLEDK